ncbi:MAG: ABC transporter ATP-binding protein [Lachnospiraceae bacterium]|nr:ABC transporter ATP-binding protein [Lachnospiraceae bacterium]
MAVKRPEPMMKMGGGRGPGSRPPRGVKGAKVENAGKIFKRLVAYVGKYYWFHWIVVAVCIVGSVLANLQGTMFTQSLIDDHIKPLYAAAQNGAAPDYAGLLHAMMRVVIFYALGIACTYTQARVLLVVTQGTMKRLRNEMFEHMEKLPIKYFDTHAHGDVMSLYTNDVDTMRQMISQSMPQMFNSIITVVGTFIAMIALSVPLTGLTILMVLVMLFTSGKIAGLSGKNFIAQQRNLGIVNGYIEEMMSGQKVIKVFCHEDRALQDFKELNNDLFDSAYKANKFANIMMPINAQLGTVSYVLCACVGGVLAISVGETGFFGLSVGSLVAFLTLNRSFNMPINQVSMQMNSIVMAMAGAKRVFDLLDEKPEVDEGYVTLVSVKKKDTDQIAEVLEETQERTGLWAWKHTHQADGSVTYVPLQGEVVFDGVDFGYNDDKMVLHDIKLFAKPGQKIAFVGSTGAGKTTITNLINRFYDIQDGKIRYDGINVNKIKKADLRRSLGIVLQETNLFTASVKENIRFGKLDATDEEVIAAAKLANADTFIRQLPNGYDTVLTGNGANLSQGQRQLLAIARAAIADPPVLILDEATSSIDTRTERIVQDGMDKLMHGRTTFVIAHRLSTIQNSDCIMVMEQGRIIERGNHEELLAEKGKYYQLYTGSTASA